MHACFKLKKNVYPDSSLVCYGLILSIAYVDHRKLRNREIVINLTYLCTFLFNYFTNSLLVPVGNLTARLASVKKISGYLAQTIELIFCLLPTYTLTASGVLGLIGKSFCSFLSLINSPMMRIQTHNPPDTIRTHISKHTKFFKK